MHNESGRLIDGDDVGVLVEDVDGSVFGFRFEWRKFGRFNFDNFPAPQFVRRLV